MSIFQFTHEQLTDVVKQHVLPEVRPHTIFALIGPLGVGKTALTKELLKQCGVQETVTSPTFGYVNSYTGFEGRIFHHFDLYRLASVHEFVASGFEEYLQHDNEICFIEWPEVIATLLNGPAFKQRLCVMTLSYGIQNPTCRTITIEKNIQVLK